MKNRFDTTTAYRPATPALHTVDVAEARARILWRLSEQPDGAPRDQLLPDEAANIGAASHRLVFRLGLDLRRRPGTGQAR